ncbi:hypothetical protein CFIMG_002268RA [Ceratocystis fimbriata CBS 114723]|uniref:Clr5 domain-containing protein n=1 Tax=Ceratocystis fimbriata CBS 114723 TaxID=1035309 RepID=A0A2C5X3L0_9PEZI|nr:hypothetical protein CFIMG_002268RA [Ceratocystis fimbriata CBS 114723]
MNGVHLNNQQYNPSTMRYASDRPDGPDLNLEVFDADPWDTTDYGLAASASAHGGLMSNTTMPPDRTVPITLPILSNMIDPLAFTQQSPDQVSPNTHYQTSGSVVLPDPYSMQSQSQPQSQSQSQHQANQQQHHQTQHTTQQQPLPQALPHTMAQPMPQSLSQSLPQSLPQTQQQQQQPLYSVQLPTIPQPQSTVTIPIETQLPLPAYTNQQQQQMTPTSEINEGSRMWSSISVSEIDDLPKPWAAALEMANMDKTWTNISDMNNMSNHPKMWPSDNDIMQSQQQQPTHLPVWVPIHPATGTVSPFVRISEVIDDEVPLSSGNGTGISHSPLSAPSSSIQGSPHQYQPQSQQNFPSQSPPLWSQARLPAVPLSYSKAQPVPELNDQPLSQQYDERPSSGVSSNHQPELSPVAAGGTKSWATPADWIQYRDCITRLYIEEDKPLKEVMDIMARDYAFCATEKMYKIKIKKWNLKKNLRENEVQAIIQQVTRRDAEGKPSAVMIHGKQFELTQIFRHAKKKGILKSQRRSRKRRAQEKEPAVEQDVPQYVRIYTPTPARESPQFTLRAPDALHVPEQILCNLGVWMNGKVQSGAWNYWMKSYALFNETTETKGDPTGASVTLISDFYNHFLQGLQTLRTTRDIPKATRSFNIAFATLKNVMVLDDPRLMAMLLLTGLRTEKEGHGRDLGEMLWRYVRELSPCCVGAHSPLNRVWGTIATAFIYNDVGQSMVLMRFLADQIKTWADNSSAMYVDFFMFQSEIERLSFGSSPATRATLRQILQEARHSPMQDYDNIVLQKNVCHQIARSLIKDNHPEEARTVLLQTPAAPLNNSRSARVVYLDLLANIELECGMVDIAAETMEKAVTLSTALWGELSSSTMYMVDTLIKIYSQMGALDRADALQLDFSRRERFLESYHGEQMPQHIPPVQIGC